MQRIGLTFGIIAGTIVIGAMLTSNMLAATENWTGFPEWLGYLFMLVGLSLIFIGVKRFRDHEQGGVITFGKATLVGLFIAVVASFTYVAIWEVYLALTDHSFIGEYTQSLIDARRAEGVSSAELSTYIAEMEAYRASYANPFFRLPITFIEIFPMGLVIAFISAAVLRKSEILPASA